jgi:hypothetical protein
MSHEFIDEEALNVLRITDELNRPDPENDIYKKSVKCNRGKI